MPVEANITPIGDSASNSTSWRSIGDIADDLLLRRYACVQGEDIQGIAERKAFEVIFALDNDDFMGAKMAQESLERFFADYRRARLLDADHGGSE